jgi:hypothetical protein
VFFLCGSLRFSKSHTLTASVILNELNASIFQSSADGGFVSECNWNLAINDLRSTDRRYPDF